MTRRGQEVRPGQHEALLTEEEFRDAVAGVEARKRQKGARLRERAVGATCCEASCIAPAAGEGAVTRESAETRVEILFVPCLGRPGRYDDEGNLVACHAKRVRADEAERFVTDALSSFLLPAEAVGKAREDFVRTAPGTEARGGGRAARPLRARLERLRDLYAWGDLSEQDFRKQKAEAEAQLLVLPDNNKLVLFDKPRALAASLPDAIVGCHA